MSMLRTRFLKDYEYRDNWGDVEGFGVVTVHLANSSWESDVLHIGMEHSGERVQMNFTLDEAKELAAEINKFIQSAEQPAERDPLDVARGEQQ